MQIKPETIYACSSEHEKYPASNLLGDDKQKKWRCKDIGEESAFVTLQLKKPFQITGIDIGNDHSCFIEVLVGRRGMRESEFEAILLTSSFMTPAESRNSENINRVRCFSQQALVPSPLDKKWDLVRIFCTQPFNSRVQYGISFITIYAEDEKEPNTTVIGNGKASKNSLFNLREDSPDTDTGESLFSRWKQSRSSQDNKKPTSSVAAAIRDAPASPTVQLLSPMLQQPKASEKKRSEASPKPETLNRNRSKLIYDDDEDEGKGDEKLEKIIEEDKKRAHAEVTSTKERHKDHSVAAPSKKMRLSQPVSQEKQRQSSPTVAVVANKDVVQVAKKVKTYKPFSKLLEGVVFAISGIQNPERADIRAKALEIGAKYKSDWDSRTCSHLICAFRNTPKYNQVQQSGGKIVKKEWILQCHANRKKIPWRRFALDNKEADKDESEEEIYDERDREPDPATSTSTNASSRNNEGGAKDNDEDDDDVLIHYQDEIAPVLVEDSDSGSEADAKKKQMKNEVSKGDSQSVSNNRTVFEVSTEEEEETESNMEAKNQEFLKGKLFYLDDDIGAVKIIKLNEIITKFKGEITEDQTKCDYWIKNRPRATTAEDDKGSKCKLLRPLWLEECAGMESLLPINRYLL